MSISMGLKRSILERWRQAQFRANESDWIRATVAVDIFSALEGESRKQINTWIHEHLSTASSVKTNLRDMAAAMQCVPDEDIWLAVGWRGVRKLAAMTKAKRKDKVKEIRAEANGGKLPRRTAHRILPSSAPTPRPAAKGPSGHSPIPVAAAERAAKADLLNDALATLAKLAALNPVNLDVMPANVRKAVESRMKARAA